MSAHNLDDEEWIFHSARMIEAPEARDRFLDHVCGGDAALRSRIQALLRVHERDGDFLKSPSGAGALADGSIKESPGSIIGPYKLLEQIGEGGFGVVFMAEQQSPIRRKVALKVLKPGMDSRSVVARFEAERQALALMEHQNIARVLDAGETASGRPYFVMELVRGIPITSFCDDNHHLVHDRLRLFVDVCQAVQHAHQKGIIHRDLKPSNILVTLHDGKPVPKVIDFGIAKAMGQQLTDKTLFTGFARMIGTPSYMSPEQAEMSGLDADTRSDIYALGILLYELLTGAPPFDQDRVRLAGFDEIRRIIREEEPPKPSTRMSTLGELASTVSASRRSDPRGLSQLYRGELDWIVMKALEKDRNLRYETASALAADVQRYLNNETVLACPPSTWYRLRKTVRRYRTAVVAASFVLLTLLAGTFAATWGFIRATNAEAAALGEAKQREIALLDRETALAAARQSERDAREQLFLSLLNQARAGRFSRQMGQRLDSLEALAKAARLRSDERLRDEAIAAMAHPDIRPGPRWRALEPGTQCWTFGDNYRLFARAGPHVGEGGIIRIYSVPNGKKVNLALAEIQNIRCGPKRTDSLVFSPEGQYLAQIEEGNKLRVWRVADGEVMLQTPAPVGSHAFSLDGRRLIVAHLGWLLHYDVATGMELNRWQLPQSAKSWGLAFHPDNRRLAVGYEDSDTVSIYDSTNGGLVAKLPTGEGREQAVAWHPDGARLAVGQSQFIQIWDVDQQRKLATLTGHVQQVVSLTFHPGGGLLASRSWDGVLRLWDPATGRQLLKLPLLVYLNFSRDGRWLGVAESGDEMQLLEMTTSQEFRTLENRLGVGHGAYADGDISPDGSLLALNMGADGVLVWHLASGCQVADLPAGAPVFADNGRELIVCNREGLHRRSILMDHLSVPAWKADNIALRIGDPRTVPLPAPPVRVVRTPNGRTLAMVSESKGMAWLFDLDTESVRVARMDHVQAGYVALSPDAKWVATSGWHSDQVRLWSADNAQMVHEWPLHRTSAFFTPDSQVLILSKGDEFSFFDVQTRKLLHRIRRDVALYPGHVAFAPKTKLMALEMAPGIVHLKEISTGKTVAKLEDPHGDRAAWMGFTPDGSQLVVVAHYARAIHVWDLRAIRARLKTMNLDWNWPDFAPQEK